MKCCSVLNCHNTGQKGDNLIRFFPLPKNNKLAKKWMSFCGNPKLKYNTRTVVCSAHFKPDDIAVGRRFTGGMCSGQLKPGAIPCIRKAESESPKELFKRTKQRINKDLDNDLSASSHIKVKASESHDKQEASCITQPELEFTEYKSNSLKLDDLLDTESSEAVIDELSNRNNDLQLENLRLNVNFQLAEKKYKAEIRKLKKGLREAVSQIIHLQMQLEDTK